MQYVRSFSGSVSKTWNSINPATLSGAIDVVVVELEDGTLACSPFHVRFGKFSLLRPTEKKVEFKVNNVKQNYSMKLGDAGEAFFVFETSADIPESLQTSPLVSPVASPSSLTQKDTSETSLQEPEFLDLGADNSRRRPMSAIYQPNSIPLLNSAARALSDLGNITPISGSPPIEYGRPVSGDWSGTLVAPTAIFERASSEELVPTVEKEQLAKYENILRPLPVARVSEPTGTLQAAESLGQRSTSPPPVSMIEAVNRAISLSKKLSGSNIPTQVTESGDLMLDINGYKSSEEDALRAELIARKILAKELKGNYDIGALIGADENGNLWIYSSEEAKEAAMRKATRIDGHPPVVIEDTVSDPGYHSDEDRSVAGTEASPELQQIPSDRQPVGLVTPPQTPPDVLTAGDPNRNYAKTLRLTSDQLKALNLKKGPNTMSFSVNRATCTANMYYWSYNVPVVISDIDGTITKSDALGHVLNMIGRDWTHIGVAKLYTDIVANGYNILYLTSRSVGQADTTRAYLHGVVQDGYKLPRGPVILSPDRTIAALRREIYLRKPEVFKMACLRDILGLFGNRKNPFYAGFGNRFTDALSYRSVNIPPNRIFTINSNAEVSLDLLTLTKYKSTYVSMREIVDHFFPPVGLLVTGGGEEFTDFNYWRETPLELDDFSASDSDDDDNPRLGRDRRSVRSEDEGSEGLYDEQMERMAESYMSRDSIDEGNLDDSIMESIEDGDDSRRFSLEEDQQSDEDEYEEGPTPLADAMDGLDITTQQRGRPLSYKPVTPGR